MAETKVKKAKVESTTEEVDANQRFMYVLAEKNDRLGGIYDARTNREVTGNAYKPYRNLLLTGAILWPGDEKLDEQGKVISGFPKGKRHICYYDGCSSIFVDEQPKENATRIKLLEATRQIAFNNGYLSVFGYETKLKKFCDIASWNGDSPYRLPNAPVVYLNVDSESEKAAIADSLDSLEEALKMAKEASDMHVLVHGRYLGVPELDEITGNQLSQKAIRALYRKKAQDNPDEFIKSYSDKSISIKYFVEKAIEAGEINTNTNTNKAVWRKSNQIITDISGIKSQEGIKSALVEFAQSTEGEEFAIQLKALYN